MKRKRIALVTDAIYPYHRGGKEVRYHEVAQRLARVADVDVYTMRWWEGPATRVEDDVRYIGLSPLHPLYVGRRRSITQALRFAMACFALLFRDFDVVEADHMPYIQLFPLRLVTWFRRKRLVVTWHEVWGPTYWREYLGRPGYFGWRFEKLAMRLPDEIIAASEQTAERLRAHLGEDAALTVAPNGVDLQSIRSAKPASDWSGDVVTVGRMLPHKRFDLLLDSLAILQQRGRPLSCCVIGDGPLRDELIMQAERLGIRHLVKFDNAVGSQQRLYSLLRSARVFAFPSEREGFGIAALEAMASGLPVVATNAPDNHARFLVHRDPRSIETEAEPERYADALEAALAQDRSSPSADHWTSEFDWDVVAGRVAGACLR